MTSFSRFNVLDRRESVHRHLFLEASAGTGKTFAIENIVVRLIIESTDADPLLIENILVVTFTKMAASELKERIHSNLEKCLDLLNQALFEETIEKELPDYLQAHVEQGEEAIIKAKKSIERALFSFDRAQIFTIHGFCWRMLKSYSLEAEISLDAGSAEDGSASRTQLLQVVRDFLRCELDPLVYSPQQLKIIMNRVSKDYDKLQHDLLNEVSKGIDIEPSASFSEIFKQFQLVMSRLKQEFRYESHKILEDCLTLVPLYKGICDRNGKINPENLEKFERFASLFNVNEWTAKDLDDLIEVGIFPLEVFTPDQLKAKGKPLLTALSYPSLLNTLKEHLEPLISAAGNKAAIFSRLASDCQQFVHRYQEQEELFNHSDLLVQMKKAIEKPAFVKRIRSIYHAAIVDEFQDTDPLQWEIFSTLFSSKEHWKGYFNLIGDPKQSIYAFRQADIYTYLRAAETLGSDALMTLDTNFRSQPSLIDALNGLFNSAFETFSLPKLSASLPYRNVLAGRKQGSGLCTGPSLQLWEVRNKASRKKSFEQSEIDMILPAIAKEILLLNGQGFRFDQFAILVSDKHQAKRAFDFLKKLDIPAKSQKGIDLNSTTVVHDMRDLLNGVIHYRSKSDLNTALACRLIGMTHKDLVQMEDECSLLPVVEKFSQLHKSFTHFGFSKFYCEFMDSSWHPDQASVLERLLNQSGGAEYYREWQDLADLLIAEEQSQQLHPQGLIAYLDELEILSLDEDERIKAYVDPDEEGVTILTSHLSKGLEFDIVFAVGLITHPPSSEDRLILLNSQNKTVLGAVESKNDPRFKKYCEEIDAEKMRQLYVALTRAREKLYIPVIIEESAKEIPFGCASPMELFLARLDKPPTDYQGMYQRIASEDGSTLTALAAKFPETINLSRLEESQEGINLIRKRAEPPLLISPNEINVPGSLQIIQSFTSLAQNINANPYVFDEELCVPHDFASVEKTEHSLPSGHETGVFLHKIFELLPFDSVRNLKTHEALKPLISPFLQGSPFVQWEEAIAKIVFNALKTPLNSGFCLADVNPKKIYRETEFLYPCDNHHPMFQGIQVKPGFLKGVVDLFFEHEGKYYLIDWKSNWLGPSQEYYKQQNLEESMIANSYDLQAKIYCEAFQRYLKVFDKRPFHEYFGGIYYFFVRGISPTTGILDIPNGSAK